MDEFTCQNEMLTSRDIAITPLGDRAILIRFGTEINEDTFQSVRSAMACLDSFQHPHLVECVPTYTGVAIYYDALKTSLAEFVALMEVTLQQMPPTHEAEPRIIDLPVCYGGEFGPDLAAVAEYCNLSCDEVVAIHSGGMYLVHMLGFVPGFPYLGGMSPSIAMPPRVAAAVHSGRIGGHCGRSNGRLSAGNARRLAVDRPHATRTLSSPGACSHIAPSGRCGAF